MAFAYFDRVKETTTTTGTGVLALAGAVAGFQAFSAVYANNDTLHYTIYHAASGAWEVGLGTWATGNTLTRTTVLASSNAGAAVNFAAGTKDVFVVYPAGVPSTQSASFFSVANSTARDAIPAALLRLGALVRLLDTGAFYHWNGSAWVSFLGFAPTGSATGQTQIWNGTTWVAGALDLADADAVTGLLPHGNIASLAGLSVFGRGANTTGVMAAITGVDGQALRVSGTVLGFGTLATAAYANSSVTLAKIADSGAASVLGRSAGTSGVLADISSSADGQVLRRAGGVLAWGALDLADADAATGLLPHANIASLAGLSVFGRGANTTGVMAAITGTDGQVLRVSGTTLGFGTIVTAGIADGAVTLAKLANASAASVLGRSANSGGVYADIASSADGQVLRRAAGVVGFGAVDLADADAVTGLLPGANVTPNFGTGASIIGGTLSLGATPATSGDIRLTGSTTIQVRNAGNSANVILLSRGSSDEVRVGDISAVGYQQSSLHDFRIAGASVLSLSSTVAELTGITSFRFDTTVVSPIISQEVDATAAVTGDQLQVSAQDVSGTGATVGGALLTRGGNSPDGTGGAYDARSGTGATAITAGAFTARIGSTVFLNYPGTVVPATTGILRSHHNATVLSGRDNANANNRNLLRWGTVANDLLTVGDAAVATELLGSSVAIGDGTTYLEVATLATNREIISLLLGADLTTTEMPANTGDKVLFWANATTAPTTGVPVGGAILYVSSGGTLRYRGTNASAIDGAGLWSIAPNSQWVRSYATDNTGTTNSTTLTTIGTINTDSLPNDCAGVAKAWVYTQDASNALTAQEIEVGFSRIGGTLQSGGGGNLISGSVGQGTASFGYSGDNLLVQMTSSDGVTKTYKVMVEFTLGVEG